VFIGLLDSSNSPPVKGNPSPQAGWTLMPEELTLTVARQGDNILLFLVVVVIIFNATILVSICCDLMCFSYLFSMSFFFILR